ncbi:MAG: Imm1 family immunity protein [Myxococcaceae bacterium]|nr:Imm1 family immunity protein [Myxococcaceae bacterium]
MAGKVKVLVYEDLGARRATGSKEVKVSDPSWHEIETAIRAMDGAERTSVVLRPSLEDPETMLVVGGGENDRRVCFFYDGDEYNLVDQDNDSQEPVEVLMGQTSVRSRRELVPLEAVLAAVERFFETGAIQGDAWLKQELPSLQVHEPGPRDGSPGGR